MPKIAEIESTPNPNAVKFILKEPLTWGVAHSFDTHEEAQANPLAKALFDIEHVTNVFYVDHWLTVTQDGEADWSQLKRQVAEPIRAAPGADEDTTVRVAAAAAEMTSDELTPEMRERLSKINALLDEEIRPYLQGDGGDVYILGLKENVLTVHYQGACGSCPSSLSGTLVGIENLLRTIEPDIQVVAD